MSFSTDSGFRKGLKRLGFVSAIFYLSLTGGGGCNIFSETANTNSDNAILFHAQQQIDAGQWTAAIATIGTMSASGQASGSVKYILATAYAGRGGLNLLQLSQKMQNSLGQTFFKFLMTTFTGVTASQLNDLVTAEAIVQTMAVNAVNRSADQNMFMMFLEMAKLGSILSFVADHDADGVVDPGFDNCTNTPNIWAAHTITAIANIIDSSVGAGSNVGAGFINGISAQCAFLGGTCAVYQTANVTALEEKFAKTLIGETALGIGLAIQPGVCEVPPAGNNCEGQGAGIGLCP